MVTPSSLSKQNLPRMIWTARLVVSETDLAAKSAGKNAKIIAAGLRRWKDYENFQTLPLMIH
jgi:hypothetical protein